MVPRFWQVKQEREKEQTSERLTLVAAFCQTAYLTGSDFVNFPWPNTIYKGSQL